MHPRLCRRSCSCRRLKSRRRDLKWVSHEKEEWHNRIKMIGHCPRCESRLVWYERNKRVLGVGFSLA